MEKLKRRVYKYNNLQTSEQLIGQESSGKCMLKFKIITHLEKKVLYGLMVVRDGQCFLFETVVLKNLA